jgi:hypothetical protein
VIYYLTFLFLNNIINAWFPPYDANHHYKRGEVVVVHYGLYEDCVGPVINDAWSVDEYDRLGVLHPAEFAGYNVLIDCKGQKGLRFFEQSFLRPYIK